MYFFRVKRYRFWICRDAINGVVHSCGFVILAGFYLAYCLAERHLSLSHIFSGNLPQSRISKKSPFGAYLVGKK
jgi:hypothetical protein